MMSRGQTRGAQQALVYVHMYEKEKDEKRAKMRKEITELAARRR